MAANPKPPVPAFRVAGQLAEAGMKKMRLTQAHISQLRAEFPWLREFDLRPGQQLRFARVTDELLELVPEGYSWEGNHGDIEHSTRVYLVLQRGSQVAAEEVDAEWEYEKASGSRSYDQGRKVGEALAEALAEGAELVAIVVKRTDHVDTTIESRPMEVEWAIHKPKGFSPQQFLQRAHERAAEQIAAAMASANEA